LEAPVRKLILGLAIAAGLAGAAEAADFVVVSSTDPTIARGREVASGESLQITPGRSIVLVDKAGQVTRLAGAAGPVVAPRRQYANLNEDRVQVLKMLVGPARVRRAAPSLDKVCPDADLTKFDGIVTVAQVDGCLTTARAAFEAYVLKAVGPEAP
jgi:hypothetical protein